VPDLPDPGELLDLLVHEPFLGLGSGGSDDAGWRRELTREVARYDGVTDVEDYLLRTTRGVLEAFRARSVDSESTAPERSSGTRATDRSKVFVIHGRDAEAKAAVFELLGAFGLRPLEWEELVKATGELNPDVLDVVVKGFEMAQAALVLFTPDDVVELHPELQDPDHREERSCQPRPNVLLEAGMARVLHPDRTLIVRLGNLRMITDITGLHIPRLDDPASVEVLRQRLASAGCPAEPLPEDSKLPEMLKGLRGANRVADESPV
jgi:predicted nucleotide-binding protein